MLRNRNLIETRLGSHNGAELFYKVISEKFIGLDIKINIKVLWLSNNWNIIIILYLILILIPATKRICFEILFMSLISFSDAGRFSFHSGGDNRIFRCSCWSASWGNLIFSSNLFCVRVHCHLTVFDDLCVHLGGPPKFSIVMQNWLKQVFIWSGCSWRVVNVKQMHLKSPLFQNN